MAKQIPLPSKYDIPSNWCWIDMGELVRIKSGFPFDSKRFSSDPDGKRPLIRIRDVLRGSTATFTDEDCPEEYIIHPEEILIGMDGDFNVAKWKSKEALLNQRVCCIESDSEHLLSDFLYYYLPAPLKKINEATPSVTVKHLSTKTLLQTPLPLPPLTEQKRIVNRIENLFAKLDEAKEKAQIVVDGFELRKSAILHKAFTGELTEQWRKEHGVGVEKWMDRTLESVCYSIFDGDHMPPPKSDVGIPFLVISNVNTGYLSFDNTRFVPESYYNALHNTRKPQIGDVLYTLVGSYGISVIIDSERPFCFQRHMALLKPKDVESRYLWYVLQSKEIYQKATDIATGTAQLTVPIKGLRKIKIPYASKPEQMEIVHILDTLLTKEQQAQKTAESVLNQIDTMKKSILSRAFRGKLGTNDPTEESALTFLSHMGNNRNK